MFGAGMNQAGPESTDIPKQITVISSRIVL
jgi:hypothetical protein